MLRRISLAAVAVALVPLACGDDDPTDPDPDPTPTPTGDILVASSTFGEDIDPDGYTASAAGETQALPIDGEAIFTDVEVGERTVELTGIADNCAPAGANPRTVTVAEEMTVQTTFNVECAKLPPTIDGVRVGDEWDDATMVPAFSGATFLYKNQGGTLYLAFEVDDGTFTDGDRIAIRFDNERNGTLEAGEDQLNLTGAGTFGDNHRTESSWGVQDLQQDGEGAAGTTGGTNFFELAHPLDSGDADDFALASGDVVGYCLIYVDDGTGTTDLTFPTGCQLAGDDLSGYAELTIE